MVHVCPPFLGVTRLVSEFRFTYPRDSSRLCIIGLTYKYVVCHIYIKELQQNLEKVFFCNPDRAVELTKRHLLDSYFAFM